MPNRPPASVRWNARPSSCAHQTTLRTLIELRRPQICSMRSLLRWPAAAGAADVDRPQETTARRRHSPDVPRYPPRPRHKEPALRSRTAISSTPTATASRASPSPCRTSASPIRPTTPARRSGCSSRPRRRAPSLVAFPELGLSAYTCDDLFHQRALLDGCEAALGRVAEATASIPVMAIVGLPLRVDHRLFNCAAVVARRPGARRRAEDLPAELRRVLRGAPVQRPATPRCRPRCACSAPTCPSAPT